MIDSRHPMHPAVMSVRDAAQEAIKLLESGWTQSEPAVDAKGREAPAWSAKAVAWTLMGAVCAVNCTDRIRLMVIGKIVAMGSKKLTELNTSKEEAIKWLSMVP